MRPGRRAARGDADHVVARRQPRLESERDRARLVGAGRDRADHVVAALSACSPAATTPGARERARAE